MGPCMSSLIGIIDKRTYRYYWLKRVQKNPLIFYYAPKRIKNDKRIVMVAVTKYDGHYLMYASPRLQNDKEIVMAAVKTGTAAGGIGGAFLVSPLKHASPTLQNDKEIVLIAVKDNPNCIKYAGDDVKRDPEILIAAGMYDEHHDDAITRQQQQQTNNNNNTKKKKKIVLSTRFSLNPNRYSQATKFTKDLKDHEHIQNNFITYAPNAFDKKTCDPKWTDFNHPCRGTNDTCQHKNNVLTETGHPTDDCCWRYSFRSQLQEAKDTGGFMLQLVETGEYERKVDDATLGNGQAIERDMAHSLQLKIFHVYRPISYFGNEGNFNERHIEEVVTAIKSWYDTGCKDMSECIIRPIADMNSAVYRLTLKNNGLH